MGTYPTDNIIASIPICTCAELSRSVIYYVDMTYYILLGLLPCRLIRLMYSNGLQLANFESKQMAATICCIWRLCVRIRRGRYAINNNIIIVHDILIM